MSSKIDDDQKYLYEKAIEGRKFHMECFNHWMNMYAIINGALFAGLYSVKDSTAYSLSILVLGCMAGWFWFFSVCGFYRWIISWIRVVSHYEEKLLSQEPPKDNCLVYKIFDVSAGVAPALPKNNCLVYKIFDENNENKENEENKTKKIEWLYPFSTQKITRAFTFGVAMVWTILLAYKLSSSNGFWEKLIANITNPTFKIVFGIIIGIVFVIAVILPIIETVLKKIWEVIKQPLQALKKMREVIKQPLQALKKILSTILSIILFPIKLILLREDLSKTHESFAKTKTTNKKK